MSDVDLSEALRLIRKHMQLGDTVGKMFLRVAKVLEAEQFTQSGEVCDGCGKVLICRNCGKFRSGEPQEDRRSPRELTDREPDHGQYAVEPRTGAVGKYDLRLPVRRTRRD